MLSKGQFEADLEVIFKNTNKNEKLAWARKKKKMDDIIEKLRPIETAILDLMAQKQPILDEIAELRKTMVRECIHPPEVLVHHGNSVECKFCNVNITVNHPFQKS